MIGSGSSSRGDGESGVTLIEIVVALAVVALTLLIAGNAVRLLARGGDRGAAVIARHDALSRAIDVVRRDIERRERVVRKRDDGAEFVFQGDATGLSFVAVEPPFPSEGGAYLLSYSIRQGPEGAVLARDRIPFQASAGDTRRPRAEDTAVVLEGPYRLRFLYLDRKEERARWQPQWSDPHSLPDLIGLEIASLSGSRDGVPLIVFRPKVDAEHGCIKENDRKEGDSKESAGLCTIGSGGAIGSAVKPGDRK